MDYDGLRTVRYEGDTDVAVGDLWIDDDQRIQAAGWRQVGDARWVPDTPRPTLVVDYAWAPPDRLTRSIPCEAEEALAILETETTRMATAGYAPEDHAWHRLVATNGAMVVYGYGPGTLDITFLHGPDLTGIPVREIPPLPGWPRPHWGNVPKDRRHHPIHARHRVAEAE